MASVTIGSTGLIHSPGFVPWLKRVYSTDPARAFELAASALPTAPIGLIYDYFNDDALAIVGPDGDSIAITHPTEEEA